MPTPYENLLHSVRSTNVLQESPPTPLPHELELQSIWFNGQFGRDFTTTCGKPVRIRQFGLWNRSGGPDFLNAAIELDGKTLSGPLEIDTQASDWENHGHATNPAFDDTILHVIFTPTQATHFTRTSKHREIPKVIIPEEIIANTLNHPIHSTANAHPGRCSFPLEHYSPEKLTKLLEQAAKHRATQKANQLLTIQSIHGKDQALWIALAQTLGYRPNKLAMSLLAQRLPIHFLHQHTQLTAPLLFGAAGFLHPDIHKNAPADSQQWLRELWDTWWQHRTNHELTAERAIPWSLAGIRPVNHPQRRLAALSQIAKHWPTFTKLSTQPKALTDWLTTLTDPFWSHHYTLTSKRSEKPLALIGKDRIRDLLTNHLLPLQITSENTHAWQSYLALPAPSINEKVDKAAIRLLGQRPDKSTFLKKAYQHQAFLQIYQDFCLQDTSDCQNCPFPEQLKNLGNP